MVLVGKMSTRLVAALTGAGVNAMGMAGGDGKAFTARQKKKPPGLGFVGDITNVDTKWLQAIWDLKAVPVISPIALGVDHEHYNINADEMAASCAIALKADALVFLTDVSGVKDAKGNPIRWLPLDEISTLYLSRMKFWLEGFVNVVMIRCMDARLAYD